jgi:hypothetical protein
LDVVTQGIIYIDDNDIIIFNSDIDFESFGTEFVSGMSYQVYIEAITSGQKTFYLPLTVSLLDLSDNSYNFEPSVFDIGQSYTVTKTS